MKKSRCRPSFFKVLIRYTTKLMLPPYFVREFGKCIPKTAKLRTISGETWDVKLKREICDDDGKSYLWFVGGGWAKFVKDLDLKFGEFIVFFLNVAQSTFDVSVYGTNLCQKPRMDAHSEQIQSENDSHSFPETSSAKVIQNRKPLYYYEITLKCHQRSRVTLKRSFLRAAGLAKKEMVRVVGKHHGEWIELDNRDGGRIDLSKGWHEFRLANALEFEKTYSFEFKPTKNAIYVKEVNLGN